MKILVLGGTYFAGRAFVELAKHNNEVTIVNRGTKPEIFEDVTRIQADRTDHESLEKCGLNGLCFDAVVDFCAYNPGDILGFLKYSGVKTKQYIFISTCDVYPHDKRTLISEESEYEQKEYPGPEGAYISGKVALESELQQAKEIYNINVTSFRPAFIYGPNNYAPRERIYFQWIVQAGQILHPADASGHFQFVYVKDVARAILMSAGNEKAYNNAYNLCGNELITYESFSEVLNRICERPFERVDIDLQQVFEKNIPLPFPLLKEESQQYDGSKIEKELGFEYTELTAGLKETFEWFMRSCNGN